MKLKNLISGLFAFALVLMSVLQASASGPATALTALYDPATGNIKLQNTTATSGSYQSIDLITTNDNGGNGWLSGSAATLPSPAAFTVSNSSPFGYNGLYSQIAAGNVGSVLSGMILTGFPGWNSASPSVGPSGSYFDLGNVAATGMTQGQIDLRFFTDPENTPGGTSQFGKFLVSYGTAPTATAAILALTPVPEPSTYAMAFAGLASCGFSVWRKRRKA